MQTARSCSKKQLKWKFSVHNQVNPMHSDTRTRRRGAAASTCNREAVPCAHRDLREFVDHWRLYTAQIGLCCSRRRDVQSRDRHGRPRRPQDNDEYQNPPIQALGVERATAIQHMLRYSAIHAQIALL